MGAHAACMHSLMHASVGVCIPHALSVFVHNNK